ncbi:beta strand repeat-containing protein, partial [Flavobacterium facile]|uniref:beta strand repeat-containing protein n=1 Tax=Flavobacterium facile TaxID=2893174 RepID=UPI002E76557D
MIKLRELKINIMKTNNIYMSENKSNKVSFVLTDSDKVNSSRSTIKSIVFDFISKKANYMAFLFLFLLSFINASAQTSVTPEAGYSNALRYSYTGSDQTFTVPAGVYSIYVKIWAAGGSMETVNPARGGAGGFTMGTIPVTPGQVLKIMVGQGGLQLGGTSYGFGGADGVSSSGFCSGGNDASGGGLSGIFTDNLPITNTSHARALLIAGGGGSGGLMTQRTVGEYAILSGQPGNSLTIPYNSTFNGSSGDGDCVTRHGEQSAGAGGGYGGGNNSAVYSSFSQPASIGGAGYISSVVTGGSMLGTSYVESIANTIPPMTSDVHYVSGVGVGGYGNTGDPTVPGGNGMVVLEYAVNCINQPTIVLSATSGSTCVSTPITVSGNTFGGSATAVTISSNGLGTVTASASSSPFSFTYTPGAGDAGNVVTITVTTNNPNGAPCTAATATYSLTVAPNNTTSSNVTRTMCIDTAISPALTHTTTGATGIGVATGLPTGVTASWASNSISLTGTPTVAGTFNYIIPLTGGCGSINATGTIIVTPNSSASSNATRVLCVNTSISPDITHTTTGVTGIGAASGLPTGVTASFSSNTITISGTPTSMGTYNYSIPLIPDCGLASATGTIVVNGPVSITILPATPGTVCVGGATTLNATPAGGTWTSNSPNAVITQNNADGTAFVTINGTGDFTFNYSHPGVAGVSCANSVNNITLVTGVANPATPTVSTTVATCSAAGTASITNYNATYVYTFAPSGPTVGAAGTITGMLAGQSYTVTAATVAGNCTSLPSAPFSVQPMLVTPATPTIGSVIQPTCSVANGTFVITNYSSANTYSITSPTGTVVSGPTATGLVTVTEGVYTITANANGCTSAPVNVTINAQPVTPAVPTVSPVTHPTCSVATGSFTITNYNATNTYTFVPAGPTIDASGVVTASTGSYTLTASANGCTSASVSVTVNAQPATPATPTIGSVTQPTCSVANGTFVITNYSSANTYSITSPTGTVVSGPTATGLVTVTAGSYTVTSTSNGCTSAPVNVTINAQPVTPAVPTVSPVTHPTCSVATGSFTITN